MFIFTIVTLCKIKRLIFIELHTVSSTLNLKVLNVNIYSNLKLTCNFNHNYRGENLVSQYKGLWIMTITFRKLEFIQEKRAFVAV